MARQYVIPVSNGIFDHYASIGPALWLFLWYVDKTTREVESAPGVKVGYVCGGAPMRDDKAADVIRVPRRTVADWRERLASAGYIRQTRTPMGYVVTVNKSKKWLREVFAQERKFANSWRKFANAGGNPPTNKDNAVDCAKTKQADVLTHAQEKQNAARVWGQLKSTPEGKALAERLGC